MVFDGNVIFVYPILDVSRAMINLSVTHLFILEISNHCKFISDMSKSNGQSNRPLQIWSKELELGCFI